MESDLPVVSDGEATKPHARRDKSAATVDVKPVWATAWTTSDTIDVSTTQSRDVSRFDWLSKA